MISAAVGRGGETMISAQTVGAFWNAVRTHQPLAIGLNCSIGPDLMYPFLEELGQKSDAGISATRTPACRTRSPTGFDLKPAPTWAVSSASLQTAACSTSPVAAAATPPSTSPPSRKALEGRPPGSDCAAGDS
jgi:5-methyltetrahydrofolate--homocysteine methyltransferase